MDILTKIKPVPQKVTQGNGKVIIGKSGKPDFCIMSDNCNGKLSQNALALMKKKLLATVGGKMNSEAKTFIRTSITSNAPSEIQKNSNQAYRIEASRNEVLITAYGEEGLYYAITTLLQCVLIENNTVFIPEMSVLDWPDLRTRGHFMECRFGSNLIVKVRRR